jgi:hypothetical protein
MGLPPREVEHLSCMKADKYLEGFPKMQEIKDKLFQVDI